MILFTAAIRARVIVSANKVRTIVSCSGKIQNAENEKVPGNFFSFILLIHEGSHREVYQEFQPSYDIFCRWYTGQLLTLHQHRANNQYRTANQISPTLWVSSSTLATLEQCPIQVLTELNVA